jgi:hypothetical protein
MIKKNWLFNGSFLLALIITAFMRTMRLFLVMLSCRNDNHPFAQIFQVGLNHPMKK